MMLLKVCLSNIAIRVKSQRTNIYHHFERVTNTDLSQFGWLLEKLLNDSSNCPKTIIFCRNVKTVGTIYAHFSSVLKENQFVEKDCVFENRIIAQFHRSTEQEIKNFVLKEFVKINSKIRVVIATIAFGIGIDIPDVRNIIFFGLPRSVEAYAQQFGRAGRDGRQAFSICYYFSCNLSAKQSTKSMSQLIKSDICRNKLLCDHFEFSLKPHDHFYDELSNIQNCKCCDVCKKECICVNHLNLPWSGFDNNIFKSTNTHNFYNYFNENMIEMLQKNLDDLADAIDEDDSLSCHLDVIELKEAVLSSCIYFSSVEDVMTELGTDNVILCELIFEIIESIITAVF